MFLLWLRLQLRLPHVRWAVGAPRGCLLNCRLTEIAEEASRPGLSTPCHSSAHSEISLQSIKVQQDPKPVPAIQTAKVGARRSAQETEPKAAKQVGAEQTEVAAGLHHKA